MDDFLVLLRDFRSIDPQKSMECEKILQSMMKSDNSRYFGDLLDTIGKDEIDKGIIDTALTLLVRPLIFAKNCIRTRDETLSVFIPSFEVCNILYDHLLYYLKYPDEVISQKSAEVLGLLVILLFEYGEGQSYLQDFLYRINSDANSINDICFLLFFRCIITQYELNDPDLYDIHSYLIKVLHHSNNRMAEIVFEVFCSYSYRLESLFFEHIQSKNDFFELINDLLDEFEKADYILKFLAELTNYWYSWIIDNPIIIEKSLHYLTWVKDNPYGMWAIDFISSIAKIEQGIELSDSFNIINSIGYIAIPYLVSYLISNDLYEYDYDDSSELPNRAYDCLQNIALLSPTTYIPIVLDSMKDYSELIEIKMRIILIIVSNELDFDFFDPKILSTDLCTLVHGGNIKLGCLSLNLLNCIIRRFPEIITYDTISLLIEYIQCNDINISRLCSDVIITISSLINEDNLIRVCNEIIDKNSEISFSTLRSIANNITQENVLTNIYNLVLKEINCFQNDSQVSYIPHVVSLLHRIIEVLPLLIDQEYILDFNNFVFMKYELPESILLMCQICLSYKSDDLEFIDYCIRIVEAGINSQYNDSIIKSSLMSVTLYLTKCRIESYIEHLSLSILDILTSISGSIQSKTEAFDSMNSIFAQYKMQMRSELSRYRNIVISALLQICKIKGDDDELLNLCGSISEAASIVFDSQVLTEDIKNIVFTFLSYVASSPTMNLRCILGVIGFLKKMLSIDLGYIHECIDYDYQVYHLIDEASHSKHECIQEDAQTILNCIK